MATALEFVGGQDFGFEHMTEFFRQRATHIEDPYDPDAAVEDWTSPVEIPLRGYFASGGSSEQTDESREQVATTKQLVIDDPAADVLRGDRIRLGTRIWTVQGFPEADLNPFTGWQPTLVVNIADWVG